MKRMITAFCLALAVLLLACCTDAAAAEAKARIDGTVKEAQEIINASLSPTSLVSYPFAGYGDRYSTCSEAVQALYDEMLVKIENFEDFSYSTADGYSYADLDNVFLAWEAMAADHPRIDLYFMIREAETAADDMAVTLQSYYFLPGCSDAPAAGEEIRAELAVFDAMCERIVAGMDEQWSTYDKYRYLAMVITLRTAYDYDGTGGVGTSSGYNAINGGTSICSGYSAAMRLLCERAGLYCEIVSGESHGESHAWNLVMLDSGTYHVDVTWSDTNEGYDSESWHDYFMLTQEEILLDHIVWDGVVATGTQIP